MPNLAQGRTCYWTSENHLELPSMFGSWKPGADIGLFLQGGFCIAGRPFDMYMGENPFKLGTAQNETHPTTSINEVMAFLWNGLTSLRRVRDPHQDDVDRAHAVSELSKTFLVPFGLYVNLI